MRTTSTLLAVALCLLLGCGGDSSAPSSPVSVDKDRDGFTEAQGDCNDQVAAINPSGKIVVESCMWVQPQWSCPRRSDCYADENDTIHVGLINNKCSALSITDATVQITVLEANGTFNYTGQVWTHEHAEFSPTGIATGNGGTILVDAHICCTNKSGGGSYNVYGATITLQTSAGQVEAVTTNTRTDRFPFDGEVTPGLGGLQGWQPR